MNYFQFFWSRILPISYSNYLSETEILNAMSHHLNDLTNAVNAIEKFLEDNLPEEIKRQVQAEIKAAISSLEIEIATLRESLEEFEKAEDEWHEYFDNRIDALDEKLEQKAAYLKEYLDGNIAVLDAKIDMAVKNTELLVSLLEAKVDANMAQALRLIVSTHQSTVRWVRKYFDELSKHTIMVTSPISMREVTLQQALDELLMVFACTPTVWEYQSYGLTVDQYAALNLTALQYMLYGIKGRPWRCCDEGGREILLDDIMGRPRPDPVSSAYYLTDGTQPLDNYDLTVAQYDTVSNKVGMYELAIRGRYWLANIGKSVYRDVVHLRADTVTVSTSGIHHLSCLLKPDEDAMGGAIPTQDILTDSSVDKLIKDVNVEIVGWDMGFAQVFCKNPTLVAGGIALDLDVYHSAFDADDADCVVNIDISALTTTY